jgi:hypothetical protein
MLNSHLIRWVTWTVIASSVVFDLGENLWAILCPSPALEISPSTTWITEPLARDGLPDYFQAMIDLGPNGIPPEINSAAALWGVIPSKQSSENAIDHSQAHLSAADQRPESERLVMPPPPPDGMDAAEAGRILEGCTLAPWRAADHPWLAHWLEKHSVALDAITAGARREGWCPPRCLPADTPPTERFGAIPTLMSLQLPVEGAFPSVAMALLARAMRRLGEGDTPGAWHDIDTLLRFGDKISDTPGPLVCRRVAMALFTHASRATQRLMAEGDPDDALLAEIQGSLRSAIDSAPLAASIDAFERLSALDAITSMFANPSKPASLFSWGPIRILAVDPNVPLADANRFLDACVDTANQPTREARRQASQALADELVARMNAPRGSRRRFQPWHEVVSEGVSRKTLGLILPDIKIQLEKDDHARAALVLADCAAALERYRLATDKQPESLADLVPRYLTTIPTDPLTDLPIGYRFESGRFTLWSGGDPDDNAVDGFVLQGPAADSPDVPSVP